MALVARASEPWVFTCCLYGALLATWKVVASFRIQI